MQWSDSTLILAVLAQIPKLGPITLRKLLTLCGEPREIWESSWSVWKQAGASELCYQTRTQLHLESELKQLRQDLGRHSTDLVTWVDSCYPALLREVTGAPMVLYYQGDYRCVQVEPRIAVVGTRRASQEGLALSNNFAHTLASVGIVVVSGLARGIDGAAHRGALAAQGKTIAVLGGGFAKIYPHEHVGLATAIVKSGGLLLSEYPPSHPAYSAQFKARNRIIAGLTQGVVVIEAPHKSGALITADFALDHGSEVFVVPGRALDANWVGSHNLIKQGAYLVTGAEDIIARLTSLNYWFAKTGESPHFSEIEVVVLKTIAAGADSLDALLESTGVSWGKALYAVSNLQMGKYITVSVDGRLLAGPLWPKALTGLQIESSFL